jgi:hypothetical protein
MLYQSSQGWQEKHDPMPWINYFERRVQLMMSSARRRRVARRARHEDLNSIQAISQVSAISLRPNFITAA